MAIKSEEWIKYITEQVVTYIETPADVRKEQRQNQKIRREPWSIRWFGMIPLALQFWFGSRRKKRTPRAQDESGVPRYREEEEK
ncbi:YqzE family protein [Paenibacillus sp. HJGM_3]|uniref:YqzE family protein n=1 Tax=Paenibacillus sp. HJGM_3 TaxID=3379816 RepID=UPI00385CE1EB